MVFNGQSKNTMQIGAPAADFTILIGDDQFFTLFPLTKNVVLYFYPKDDTPGCTLEAKAFADRMNEFAQHETIIIGISRDNIASHQQFKEKYCLPFILGSDPDNKICELYGTWVEKSMFGKKYMGIERATFLIGKDGFIKNIWRNVKADGHAQDVLAAVLALANKKSI